MLLRLNRKLVQSRTEHVSELQKPFHHPVLNFLQRVLVVVDAPLAHYRYARCLAMVKAFPIKVRSPTWDSMSARALLQMIEQPLVPILVTRLSIYSSTLATSPRREIGAVLNKWRVPC